jgi:hypothetical protein
MAEKTTHEERYERYVPKEAREHARAARKAMRKSFEAIFPPEFVEERRTARKEMLLAFRSMLDAAIERVDEHAKEA